jgi:hypothetical protein
LLAALRALDGDFDALADAGSLRGGDGCEPFVLRLLARLATLRFVLQTLVVKENLLSRSPDKILAAIYALDITVVEFHLALTPLSICSAGNLCLCHVLSPREYELPG